MPADRDLVAFTAAVVSAYVSSNKLDPAGLPGLVAIVHGALVGLTQAKPVAPQRPTPHIPIKKTVTPDAIISLENGKPYKGLKRHLTARGLSPEQYREKWGLPADYPMIAATYFARRVELARSIGFGRRAQTAKAKKGLSIPREGRLREAGER